jgi:hypothetical protein
MHQGRVRRFLSIIDPTVSGNRPSGHGLGSTPAFQWHTLSLLFGSGRTKPGVLRMHRFSPSHASDAASSRQLWVFADWRERFNVFPIAHTAKFLTPRDAGMIHLRASAEG